MWNCAFELAVAVAQGFGVIGCHAMPGEYTALGSVAPCWDPDSPKRSSARHSLPLADPLAPRGYVVASEFRFDEYCKQGERARGQVDSDARARECIIRQCRIRMGRWKFRKPPVWTESEATECLQELAAIYDSINIAFDEPPLRELADGTEVFRLYALGSLSFADVMVRVVHQRNENVLVMKRLESNEVEGEGRLAWKRVRSFRAAEWTQLSKLVDDAMYWNLPPRTDDPDRLVRDGTMYILEGAEPSRHHLVHAVSPTGAQAELVTYLLKLAEPARNDGQCVK